jgi:membrane associated rhomboid family serine protease
MAFERYRHCSALNILLGTMACMFVINRISIVWFNSYIFNRYLSLSIRGLEAGYIWQLLSYMFMHDGIWHILCNALVLFFMGRWIEAKYGNKQLLRIFFISGILGGGAWFLTRTGHSNGILLGASTGCLGLFSYFCLACENRPMIFLLFFVIPIRLKPRMLLMIMAGLETLSFLTSESSGGYVASSAHLGGILGGCILYLWDRYLKQNISIFAKRNNVSTEKHPHLASTTHTMHSNRYKLYCTSNLAQRDEIDRILDKINKNGFKSLTEEERSVLNSAKHLMQY